MNPISTAAPEALTMTTLEIVDIIASIPDVKTKEHRNVLRDVRKQFEGLGIAALTFERSYIGQDGAKVAMYALDKVQTYILISGYSLKIRAAIVKRWMELEKIVQQGPAISATALDRILTGIEATTRTLSNVVQMQVQMKADYDARIKDVEDKVFLLDDDNGYATVAGYCKRRGIDCPVSLASLWGIQATAHCKHQGIAVGAVHSERWGSVNSYPETVLDKVIPAQVTPVAHTPAWLVIPVEIPAFLR